MVLLQIEKVNKQFSAFLLRPSLNPGLSINLTSRRFETAGGLTCGH